ncbi:hypothetical protein KHQ06_26105 [Nocardia tengchongensis]|uniref:Uncharacterized protein n=1 Tax=Nocardia tengchongensis TaxID=2055889 RepID=A0ABX8CIK3_9NOCA|nr:hypothetical protein [Nocardia tengchongensis]QVI19788.1 hypothetical protein KHQ06_26105 [Nocardia tengchongensis]
MNHFRDSPIGHPESDYVPPRSEQREADVSNPGSFEECEDFADAWQPTEVDIPDSDDEPVEMSLERRLVADELDSEG